VVGVCRRVIDAHLEAAQFLPSRSERIVEEGVIGLSVLLSFIGDNHLSLEAIEHAADFGLII